MRAATGLAVDARDVDDADLGGAGRRRGAHGADQVGLRGQLFGRDAVDRDVEAAVDQRIQAFGQIRLLPRGLGQVEIDAGGIGGNAAPGASAGGGAPSRWTR
ncbi:hypothetical protein G6F63_015630 [Rhizopus arrhizus]|nr:hypothetical protein G6F63_015630 [Rhizopus arrhizus]